MDCVIQHHDFTITHRISTLRSCSYFPTSKFYLSITFLVGFFQLPTLYPGQVNLLLRNRENAASNHLLTQR